MAMYSNNPLFKRPEGVRYVDMAIWFDNNIYKEDCDVDKAFTYLYLLAYMLASKAKYFSNISDYDGFAYYLAYSVYSRYMMKDKVKLKSVLNYMKSIMYWRKLSYEGETFKEIIDPIYNKGWNSDGYINNQLDILESKTRTDILQSSIGDVFADIPKIIKKCIPKVYRTDKYIYKNLYMSVLISMLSSYTLNNEAVARLKEKTSDTSKGKFNEALFFKKNLTRDIILWHLPSTMEQIVQLIINKVNLELINIIKDLSNDIKISNNEFELLSRSAYEVNGGTDENNEGH